VLWFEETIEAIREKMNAYFLEESS
jgi:hypothetical protein